MIVSLVWRDLLFGLCLFVCVCVGGLGWFLFVRVS